jgi:hypothetical protein
MNVMSILAFGISIGGREGPIAAGIAVIALALVIAFAWEFGRGTAGSSTVLLRGIRRRRKIRTDARRDAHARPASKSPREGKHHGAR